MSAENLSNQTQPDSPVPTTQAKQLLDSWKDREYRFTFVRERVRASVALQIRALREQRNQMTQKELAEAIGKAQTWISVLEDPEYGKMSVATLLTLAEAFDTDLEIKFRPFSRALHELTRQGPEYFEVRSFEEELPDLENAATLQWVIPSGKWSDILRAAMLLCPERSEGRSVSDLVLAVANAQPIHRSESSLPSGILEMPKDNRRIGILAPFSNVAVETESESTSQITIKHANAKVLGIQLSINPDLEVRDGRRESKRLRRPTKLVRGGEVLWQKRKRKRKKPNHSLEEERTSRPYMQTPLIFNQASGI